MATQIAQKVILRFVAASAREAEAPRRVSSSSSERSRE
jgi:hypothetical protein